MCNYIPKHEKWLKTRIIEKLIVFMHLPAKAQQKQPKKVVSRFYNQKWLYYDKGCGKTHGL
jgi:hypothetical protein